MRQERVILLGCNFWERKCAVIEDGEVVEYHYEELGNKCPVGRICAGIVEDVVPSMQSAFVKLPDGRRGYLFITETPFSRRSKIEDKLKPHQRILVQVVREEEDGKRAKLTMKVRLPGLFLVGLPYAKDVKLSHRIRNGEKLKGVLEALKSIKDMGFIIRTSAIVAEDESAIYDEAVSLRNLWIKINESDDFSIYYEEPPLHIKIVRDYIGRGIKSIITDSQELFEEVKDYVGKCRVRNKPEITLYNCKENLFEKYGVKNAINRLYERTVQLPGGGFIVIDEVEGFTGVDVNSGGFSLKSDFDENVYLVNKLAIKEIVRQVRLRNIGGIIIVDFIDVKDTDKRRQLVNKLKEEFDKDRAVVSFPEKMSKLGMMIFTREKEEVSLTKKLGVPCPHCGRGRVLSPHFLVKSALEEVDERGSFPSNKMRVKISSAFSQYSDGIYKILKVFENKTGIITALMFDRDTPIDRCYVEWIV